MVQLLADLSRVPQPAPSTRQALGATHTQLVSATKTFPTVVVPCVATPFTTTTSFINTTAQAPLAQPAQPAWPAQLAQSAQTAQMTQSALSTQPTQPALPAQLVPLAQPVHVQVQPAQATQPPLPCGTDLIGRH